MAALRYLLANATRTRAWLMPTAAWLFVLLGVYAARRNGVGSTWGLTSLATCGLSAWMTGAVLGVEPDAQRDMATIAMRGNAGRWRAGATLIVVVSVALTLSLVCYPVAAGLFAPAASAKEIAYGLVGHFCSGLAGGALGLLLSPPRVRGRASAAAAVLATLLVLIPVQSLLGHVGGPAAVAGAMIASEPHHPSANELLAAASCIGLAIGAFGAAALWQRRVA